MMKDECVFPADSFKILFTIYHLFNCQEIYMTMAFVHHLREICETGLTFILLAGVVQRGT